MKISKKRCLVLFAAFAVGMADACSMLRFGGVFASFQSGNLILMAIELARLNWKKFLPYFVSVLAFSLGIAVFTGWQHRTEKQLLCRTSPAASVVLLLAANILPSSAGVAANGILSFLCGFLYEGICQIAEKGSERKHIHTLFTVIFYGAGVFLGAWLSS